MMSTDTLIGFIPKVRHKECNMIADKLLSRLEGVRSTGKDRWLALCPAHDDHSPSLCISETYDRLLIHCFAGCSTYEVVSAIGLNLFDLFPEQNSKTGNKPFKKPIPAEPILIALGGELIFIQLCAAQMAKGHSLTEDDHQRLTTASSRIRSAISAGGLL